MSYTIKVPKESDPTTYRLYTWYGEVQEFDTEADAISWINSITSNPPEDGEVNPLEGYIVEEYTDVV